MSTQKCSADGLPASSIDIGKLHEELDPLRDAILEVIRFVASNGKETLLDYGSGSGFWCLYGSQVFDRVFGVDISDALLKSAESLANANKIDNVTFINLKDLDTADLPPLDAMLSFGVIELARSSEVIDMFRFAAGRLKNGGRFLCESRRPVGLLRPLIFLERFRWEGVFRGLRRTLALVYSAVEAVASPEIRPVPRARYYHVPKAIIDLAERSGLRLRIGPGQLAKVSAIRQLEGHYSGGRFFNLRQTDWYLFEKV